MQCECGAELLEATGEETITTLDGEHSYDRVRRYKVCPSCRKLWSKEQLKLDAILEVDPADVDAASYLSLLAEESSEGY